MLLSEVQELDYGYRIKYKSFSFDNIKVSSPTNRGGEQMERGPEIGLFG